MANQDHPMTVKRYIFHDREFREHQSGDWIDASDFTRVESERDEAVRLLRMVLPKLSHDTNCSAYWGMERDCHCLRWDIQQYLAKLESGK